MDITFPSKDVWYRYFNSIISWIEVDETTFVIYTIMVCSANILIYILICSLCSACCGFRCSRLKRRKRGQSFFKVTSDNSRAFDEEEMNYVKIDTEEITSYDMTDIEKEFPIDNTKEEPFELGNDTVVNTKK